MELPQEDVDKLTAALLAVAEGNFATRLEPGGGSAAHRIAAAFNRLLEKLDKDNTESNIAISSLATANVRVLLWNEALQMINHADSILYHGGDIAVFYERVVADAMEMTRARYGALAVFDADGGLAEFVRRGVAGVAIASVGPQSHVRGLP